MSRVRQRLQLCSNTHGAHAGAIRSRPLVLKIKYVYYLPVNRNYGTISTRMRFSNLSVMHKARVASIVLLPTHSCRHPTLDECSASAAVMLSGGAWPISRKLPVICRAKIMAWICVGRGRRRDGYWNGFELRAREGERMEREWKENGKRNGKETNRNRSSVHPIWSRAPDKRLFMQMVGIRERRTRLAVE